jgi:hypothetical protein
VSGFVLDCSVAVAWCFEDEATAELDALLDRVQRHGAVVPLLWMAEASNVLLMAQRRGRIDRETMQESLALLDMLPIETDDLARTQGSGKPKQKQCLVAKPDGRRRNGRGDRPGRQRGRDGRTVPEVPRVHGGSEQAVHQPLAGAGLLRRRESHGERRQLVGCSGLEPAVRDADAGAHQGHAAIRALFQNFQHRISFSQHNVMNPQIEVNGDKRHAIGAVNRDVLSTYYVGA